MAAVDQGQRAAAALGLDGSELFAVAAEELALTFLATDDEFEMRSRAYMPANLQQHDVVELVVLAVVRLPQVDQFARVMLVGEETAAAGR